MEHILQFAISIDDDTIKKRIEDAALEVIVRDIKKAVSARIFDNWGSLSSEAKVIVESVIHEYKQDIIERAYRSVAESIKKSKKYKEALDSIAEEIRENDWERVSEIGGSDT